nr:MAG TPA: hypothetical protein [Caudoviricetes sp.]DAV35827.1 MAG TPA: hypothetical protein [Caudoviricetes sp.]DAV93997.1 MAG TPA: hypothetical protein [Caudoviricetes sp.]DAW01712.1 MAG TPA: hypothetical protein [Caudoviricetes sp.]
MARQREREPGLLRRRPHSQRRRQDDRELLAVEGVQRRRRSRTQKRRLPYPRPRHARGLLCGLVS